MFRRRRNSNSTSSPSMCVGPVVVEVVVSDIPGRQIDESVC